MTAPALQERLDTRRYVMAALSVQWRFQRPAVPSGLVWPRPAAAHQNSKTAHAGLQERQRTRLRSLQE